MTRHFIGLVCVLGLSVMGCSETSGDGGSGGTGVADLCEGVECNDYNQCTMNTCDKGVCAATPVADGTTCDDQNECTMIACDHGLCRFATPVADGTTCDDRNECTANGVCADGMCDGTPVADGTTCGDSAGACQQGSCRVACNEQGIRDAIAAGGGPYAFDCDGPTTVVTETEIVIYNDVILDGEGNLTVDGIDLVFSVAVGVTAELRGVTATGATATGGYATIRNTGTLTLTNSTVSGYTVGIDSGLGAVTNVTNSTVSASAALMVCTGTATIVSSTLRGGVFTSPKSPCDNARVTIMSSVLDNMISGVGGCGVWHISNGYNIESPGDTCGFDQSTDQVNVSADDLRLGPLQDNGGPTETYALLPGSVAIDQTTSRSGAKRDYVGSCVCIRRANGRTVFSGDSVMMTRTFFVCWDGGERCAA